VLRGTPESTIEVRQVSPDLFVRGGLIGVDLSELLIEGLDLRGVPLKGSNLTGTSFVNCLMELTDLQGATVAGTTFIQTSLDVADFSRATLVSLSIDGKDYAGSYAIGVGLTSAGARSPWGEGKDIAAVKQALADEALQDATNALHDVLWKYWDAGDGVFRKPRLLAVHFTRGFRPPVADFIARRLYPSLEKHGYMYEATYGGHESVIELASQRRSELAEFMLYNQLSEELRSVLREAMGLDE
jgi:hypothetical protein